MLYKHVSFGKSADKSPKIVEDFLIGLKDVFLISNILVLDIFTSKPPDKGLRVLKLPLH